MIIGTLLLEAAWKRQAEADCSSPSSIATGTTCKQMESGNRSVAWFGLVR